METLHQAAKSEYLLWGQEQTVTIHSRAPAKDHSEQRLNQSVSLTWSAAYIEKTDLHQPPKLDFIVQIFRTQPTVGPRIQVHSPTACNPLFTILHLLRNLSSKVHDLSTIHHPPRSYSLQPTVYYPPHTIHHPSQSTVLFSPPSFTVHDRLQSAIPLVHDPPQSTIRHIPAIPTVLLPFLTEGLLQQAGASRAAPQYRFGK